MQVLQGSAMDMIWLQRDFGVYVVGMFDTERAAVALRYPSRGLAYLLQRFINFQAQKQHQLADWRVRPLPKDLLDYARADTHFLLYVYDCMRNELIESSNFSDPEQDLLQQVLDGSKAYQLQRYENPIYDAERGMGASGWYNQISKTPVLLSKQQFAVYRALHQWRDNVARQEDDSVHFVMNKHTLMSLAKEMPTTREKLLNASATQTAAMKQRQDELLAVISKAREDGENGREMQEVLAELDKVANQMKENRYAEKAASAAAKASKPASPIPVATPQPTIQLKCPLSSQDAIAVRTKTSKFWGSALGSGFQKRPISTDVRLALPLPDLTAEIFADPLAQTPVSQSPAVVDPGSRAEHAFVPAANRKAVDTENVFVIKELGGRKSKKRKLQDAEPAAGVDALSTQADAVALEESSDQERKRRKAEKKAAKKARKEAADGANGTDGEADEGEEHFDYDNAPSILHAQNSRESKEKRRKKGKDRGFDPYKKALDAPKGLPRAHKEKAGKSATFK
jgi:exosome complex exonuclease RRP6